MNPFKTGVAGAALLFATMTHAQDAKFSEIDVSIELNGAASANAMAYWPDIETDLEAIMLQRISSVFDPNGLFVNVSVTEISMDGETELVDKGDFNTLRGLAYVREEQGGPVIDAVAFGLRAEIWQLGLTDEMTNLDGKEEFYVTMLNRFADNLVNRVNQ